MTWLSQANRHFDFVQGGEIITFITLQELPDHENFASNCCFSNQCEHQLL